MTKLRHLLRAMRLDLALGAFGWVALLAMASPRRFAELVDVRRFDQALAFDVAAVAAFLAFSVLSLRFAARLIRAGRRASWDPEVRAIQGTVVAEFVLVLPVVLLLLGTVFQIALIANAALVVRYAAFVAARSAMVSFQADMGRDLAFSPGASLLSLMQIPPFPEWVDRERPTTAAVMVLASISPRSSSTANSSLAQSGSALEQLLEQNGTSWGTGNFARRVSYAEVATEVKTIRDRFDEGKRIGPFGGTMGAWVDSLPPLIPEPEHALQPARQRAGGIGNAYLLPTPPPIGEMIPDAIPIQVEVPLPAEADVLLSMFGVDVPSISFDIPMTQAKNLARPLTTEMDKVLGILIAGSGAGIRQAARSWWNIDPFSPKEVEITVTYLFQLSVPSLVQLAPGVSQAAPLGAGRAFKIEHPTHYSVRMQSTGGRRTLLGLVPKWKSLDWEAEGFPWKTIDNTPLYWRLRGKQDDDDEDDEDEDEDEDEEEEEIDEDDPPPPPDKPDALPPAPPSSSAPSPSTAGRVPVRRGGKWVRRRRDGRAKFPPGDENAR